MMLGPLVRKWLGYVAIIGGILLAVFYALFLVPTAIEGIFNGKLLSVFMAAGLLLPILGLLLFFSGNRRAYAFMLAGGLLTGMVVLVAGGFAAWKAVFLFTLPWAITAWLLLKFGKTNQLFSRLELRLRR